MSIPRQLALGEVIGQIKGKAQPKPRPVSLPPIGVPSDYDLDVDWPLVLPDLPNDDDEEPDQDDIAFATFEENGD